MLFWNLYYSLLTFLDSYPQIIPTFLEFISNHTSIYRELLPNNGKYFFQTFCQTILTLPKLLQNKTTQFSSEFTSNNKFTESYCQTLIHFFLPSNQTILTKVSMYKIMLNTFHINQLLKLPKNTDFLRIHINQY